MIFFRSRMTCVAFFIAVSLSWIECALAQSGSIEVVAKLIDPPGGYYNAWPTLAVKRDGELVLVYSGGRDYHICPFGRVEMMTSRDGGGTWSSPRVIMDSVVDDRDAGVLETSRGTLLVNFFTSLDYQVHMNEPDRLLKRVFGNDTERHLAAWRTVDQRATQKEKKGDVGMWMLRSADGGLTWSSRLAMPCNSPHGPIQLQDGRLLYAGKELWTERKLVGVWESDDDGVTWRLLAELPVREGESAGDYHELHAVEAADGTLLVHIRNENGKKKETLQSESYDGGKTWSTPRSIGVLGLPSHLVRLRDNTLLMTYGYRRAPFGIRAKTSVDNGRSWSSELILTQDAASWDLGYPSTVELSDGSLITVWYEVMAGERNARIRQANWRLN